MEILSLETIAIARDMFACIPNGDKTPLTPPYNEKAYTFFFCNRYEDALMKRHTDYTMQIHTNGKFVNYES